MKPKTIHYGLAFLMGTACIISAQDAKVPLTTAFPPPLTIGTPVPIKLPNLEAVDPYQKQELMVPAGTVNLALKKSVKSSDADPLLGTLDLVTDGVKNADEGNYVELAPGKQWVQIDLGAKADIYAVWVWHYHSQKRAYKGVVIQVSNDPDFIEGVKTIFNNDFDNSNGLGAGKDPAYIETEKGRLMPVKEPVQGRYVRLYSNGNSSNNSNHYIEVEVFGKPSK
jgi:hypothetical protein